MNFDWIDLVEVWAVLSFIGLLVRGGLQRRNEKIDEAAHSRFCERKP